MGRSENKWGSWPELRVVGLWPWCMESAGRAGAFLAGVGVGFAFFVAAWRLEAAPRPVPHRRTHLPPRARAVDEDGDGSEGGLLCAVLSAGTLGRLEALRLSLHCNRTLFFAPHRPPCPQPVVLVAPLFPFAQAQRRPADAGRADQSTGGGLCLLAGASGPPYAHPRSPSHVAFSRAGCFPSAICSHVYSVTF